MARLTNDARKLRDRLVAYLGADIAEEGQTVAIWDYGDGKGVPPELGPPTFTGRDRHWHVVGHLLFVATTLEECGGLGCTWEGLHEAAGFLFERRCCKQTRPATEPCPACGREGGELELPISMPGTADAMMSRLSEPEFYDWQADQIAARLAAGGDA